MTLALLLKLKCTSFVFNFQGETEPMKPFRHRYRTPYGSAGSTALFWYSIKRASTHIIVLSSYSAHILAGCSAGGLAAIQHCDEFKSTFSKRTKVKCLADDGLFLDAADVAGGRSLRSFFNGVVTIQGSAKTLPKTCTSRNDATSCFFPQNIIPNVRTPTFILNTAYDVWQLQQSLAPAHADRQGHWEACKLNHSNCNADQIKFLQGFRNEMLNSVKGFSLSRKNGLFINSCFAHCQTERQDTWYSKNAPQIGRQGIAKAVGDWYFDRVAIKAIDCPYPCDKTCHHLVFRNKK